MTSASTQADLPEHPPTSVSSDMAALASHMGECKRSRGRFFTLRSAGDLVRELVSPRVVSTAAFVIAAGLVALLVLA